MTVFYEALQEQDVNKLVHALDRDFTASASAGMPLGVGGVHEGASACGSDLWVVELRQITDTVAWGAP